MGSNQNMRSGQSTAVAGTTRKIPRQATKQSRFPEIVEPERMYVERVHKKTVNCILQNTAVSVLFACGEPPVEQNYKLQ